MRLLTDVSAVRNTSPGRSHEVSDVVVGGVLSRVLTRRRNWCSFVSIEYQSRMLACICRCAGGVVSRVWQRRGIFCELKNKRQQCSDQCGRLPQESMRPRRKRIRVLLSVQLKRDKDPRVSDIATPRCRL